MNYHPKEIMYVSSIFMNVFYILNAFSFRVTCIYLSAKVEEFNVSINQFVANIKGDREKAADVILNNELLLMEQLNFHLAIHNPFRPVEGLLIDIKTRCPQLNDPERLRPGIDQLLDKVFLTDAVLLYAPSQIALAAVLHAASKLQENLDSYVTDTLFGARGQGCLEALIEAVRTIRSMVKSADAPLDKNQLKLLDKKLDRCRNPENNPNSEMYVHY